MLSLSDSLASLFISLCCLWPLFAIFFTPAVCPCGVCPRRVLAVQTVESFVWKGRQTDTHTRTQTGAHNLEVPSMMVNQQTTGVCTNHLSAICPENNTIKSDKGRLKVRLVSSYFKSLFMP